MSEARFDKIASRLGTRPPAVEKADFCKAWVSFNMVAGVTNDSFGLSSMVDNGVGDWSCLVTTQFASGQYSVIYAGNAFRAFPAGASAASKGVNGWRYATQDASSTSVDHHFVDYAAFGDLA